MLFIECPHCQIFIEIIELNCCIFRCGILKSNNIQINPHLSKIECDKLTKDNKIYGCSKPFKIIKILNENKDINYKVEICDYI